MGGGWSVALAGDTVFASAGERGVQVVDATNVAEPELVYHFTAWPAASVDVEQGYAYVAAYFSGLHVIDVHNPAEQRHVGEVDTTGDVVGMTVSGRIAYVCNEWHNNLYLYDIAVPSAPVQVGVINSGKCYRMAVAGRYAYVPVQYDGLRIYDVGNPAQPRFVAQVDTPGRAQAVAVTDGYAYVADAYAGLRVVDVSPPDQAREVGTVVPVGVDAYDVAVAGSRTQGRQRLYAYVADSDTGLRIVNVIAPDKPAEVGHYSWSTYPGASAVAVRGNPAQEGRVIAYMGSPGGVHVVDVTVPVSPTLQSAYRLYGLGVRAVVVEGSYVYVAAESAGLYTFWSALPASAAIPAGGGILESEDGTVRYRFPAGAFSVPVDASHTDRPPSVDAPPGLQPTGICFDLSVTAQSEGAAVQPVKPYTVRIRYSEAQLGPIAEERLALYAWDGSRWLREPAGQIDRDANMLTVTLSHTSRFAVFGTSLDQFLPVVVAD
jgi:hypothetical protein